MHDLNALMVKYSISVWLDPDWWAGGHLPRWLAGRNLIAENGQYYSERTGSDGATLEADDTARGNTPLEAVLAVVAAIGAAKGETP